MGLMQQHRKDLMAKWTYDITFESCPMKCGQSASQSDNLVDLTYCNEPRSKFTSRFLSAQSGMCLCNCTRYADVK